MYDTRFIFSLKQKEIIEFLSICMYNKKKLFSLLKSSSINGFLLSLYCIFSIRDTHIDEA